MTLIKERDPLSFWGTLERITVGKLIWGWGVAGALVALLVASSAEAASHQPKGEFSPFKECPLSQRLVTDCVFSVSDSGAFTIGKKTVPITKSVTLQGGFAGEGEEIDFFGAENGRTLVSAPQAVPGGLAGVSAPTWWPEFLQEWFNAEVSAGNTRVIATLELVGPTKGLTDIFLSTENLLFEEKTALGLPVKIHLESPLLGSGCYVGWDTDPVQIDFTAGTDGRLKGTAGKADLSDGLTATVIEDGKLVNNSFVAPAAEGCGGVYSFFIDPLVNSVLGTPSRAGQSSAILEGEFKSAIAEAVKGSE